MTGTTLLADTLAYAGFPMLLLSLILLGRRSIVAYVAAIVGFGFAVPHVADTTGNILAVPMLIVLIGLLVMFLKDAWMGDLSL